MPTYPQYMNAALVEFGNFTAQTAASYTASPGDVVLYTPAANSVVNLPPVASGGPVTIINLAGTFTVTAKTTDASQINGASGATGVAVAAGGVGAAATKATFASNGTSWYQVA